MRVFKLICLLFIIFSETQAQTSKDTSALIRLINMSLEELLNTKVTIATRTNVSYEKAPASVTVITSNEIQAMGARELADVLQMVSGFEVTRQVYGQNLIGVRGVKDPRTPCKILLLLDGKSINGIFYGDADYNGYTIDLENIERIEIIRGPGSAVYGRNAFSAVINMISKQGKTDKGLNVKAEVGSFNTYSGRLAYGFNKKKLNFHLAGYFIKTDGTDANYPQNSGSYPASKLWAIAHNNQVLNADFCYGNLRIAVNYAGNDLGNWNSGSEIITKGLNCMIEYKHQFNNRLKMRLKYSQMNSNYIQDLQVAAPDAAANFSGMFVKPTLKEYIYGMEAETNYQISPRNNLLVGLQSDVHGVKNAEIFSNFNLNTGTLYPGLGHSNQVKWNPGWVQGNGHNYWNMALYLQDIYYPVKKLGITLGGRYDYEDQIGGVFNPRLGVVWNFLNKTYFKAMYSEAYRSPAPSQQFQTLGFAVGSPNLSPERIKTLEFALSYQFPFMLTQINVFRNQISNLIYAETYMSSNVSGSPKNRNMGSNISSGIEVENKIKISKNINAFLNYSYTISNNTDNADGANRTYASIDVSPHKLNGGFNLAFLKYFALNSNLMYRSKMEKFTKLNTATLHYESFSLDPVGGYAIVNFTLRVANLLKGVEFGVSVYNVFNTKYYAQEPDPSVLHSPAQGNRQVLARVIYTLN